MVTGEDLDPDEVSSVLGMDAHKSWRRGERKTFVRPDGTIRVFESRHHRGGWKHRLPEKYQDLPLSEQVCHWRNRLRGLGEAIHSLMARGWVVELDCFTATNEVMVLGNRELREPRTWESISH